MLFNNGSDASMKNGGGERKRRRRKGGGEGRGERIVLER